MNAFDRRTAPRLSPLEHAKRECILDLEDWAQELGAIMGWEGLALIVLRVAQSIRTGLVGLAITQLEELSRVEGTLLVGTHKIGKEAERIAGVLRAAIKGN